MARTSSTMLALGTIAPDFSLPEPATGKTVALKDFQGKPLLVAFICNHCPYVKAIEDRLIALGKDLKTLDVSLIGICSNDSSEHPEDNFENLKKRAQEKNYSFIYLHDESQEIAQAFGAVCTPDFFVYDSDRKLAYRGRLDDSWKDASKVKQRELFSAVEKILKKQSVSEKQIPSMGCNIKWK